MQKKSTGQIGIIVLLVMTVLLTVGLSLASRTTRQTEVSVQQEDSAKVFNAAESGIEDALYNILQYEQSGVALNDDSLTVGDANVSYQITPEQTLETLIEQGSSAEVQSTLADNTITIQWWKEDQNCTTGSISSTAAILVSVYSNDGTAKYYPVDGCATDRSNRFIQANAGSGDYLYSYQVTAPTNDTVIRIKPLYNNSWIKVEGSNINTQYTVISQASSNLAGSETKAIEVTRTLSTAPEFMDYALFSGGSIN